jgi:hypothetical protein
MGVAISTKRLEALPLERHAVHGTWNYTLRPQLASCCQEAFEDHGHTCGTAPVRFPTAQALSAFLETDTRPSRTQLLEQLSHPALPGISRPDLEQLTERLAPRQLAQAERLSYQRRGGPRQSGTRSGVFHQKISNRERVLAAVLYQRRLCTMDVLADLLKVCRSSIGTPSARPARSSNRPAHLHTGTNRLPHRRGTPGLHDALDRPREHRHLDTLILYGFGGWCSAAAARPGRLPDRAQQARGAPSVTTSTGKRKAAAGQVLKEPRPRGRGLRWPPGPARGRPGYPW